MVVIKSCYSWYNVYVDNVLILKHKSQKEIEEIIKVLHETNTQYNLDLRG